MYMNVYMYIVSYSYINIEKLNINICINIIHTHIIYIYTYVHIRVCFLGGLRARGLRNSARLRTGHERSTNIGALVITYTILGVPYFIIQPL